MIFMSIKKRILFFCIFFGLLFCSTLVNATDLTIVSFQNITNNCDYNSITYTYNCSVDSSGNVWDNIYVAATINLPNNHGTYSADSTSIIFYAKNEFKANATIIASGTNSGCDKNGAGGHGGAIDITADRIIATTLNTIGALCLDDKGCDDCNTGGYGGPITLIADDIYVAHISAYGGHGSWSGASAGQGGNINIKADTLNISTIDVHSGFSSDSGGRSAGKINLDVKNIDIGTIDAYSGGSEHSAGNGGVITITAENISIDNINAPGGKGWDSSGGTGGKIDILSTHTELGAINVNGGIGKENYGGYGGSIIIRSDYIDSIGTISANTQKSADKAGRPGGSVKIVSKGNLTLGSISANGGAGGRSHSHRIGGHGGSIIVCTEGILNITSTIAASGGTGGGIKSSIGSPGGTGGTIYVTAEEITINGILNANGGKGGAANDWGSAGALYSSGFSWHW